MAIPLKVRDSSGDLQECSLTEENYFAYQIGLQLAAMDSSDTWAITFDSDNANLVGGFTDTFYTVPIGTHGTAELLSGSTTTTIFQNTQAALETGADFRRPVAWDSDLSGLKEMNDSEMNDLVDRLAVTLLTNEYPGVYRLAAAAPASGVWDKHIDAVFTDTTTDSDVAYHLWQKQSGTPPATVRPIAIKRSSGKTGTYQGCQEMTDAIMQYALGQRAKNRMVTLGLGAYQLRSSAQGIPVDPGTWVARGVAVDTKRTTSPVDYTRDSQIDSTVNSTQDFTGDFTGNYVSSVNYTFDSTVDSIADYTGDFVGDYAVSTNYTRTSVRVTTADFVGDFIGDYVSAVAFAGTTGANYTRVSVGNFTGDFVGPKTYTGQVAVNYTGNFTGSATFTGTSYFTGNFVGTSETFTRQSAGNVNYTGTKDFTRTSTGSQSVDYAGEGAFTRESTANFTGDYSNVVVNYYTGDVNYTRNSVASFTGDFTGNYTGDFVGYPNYTFNSTSAFTGNYVANFVGDYIVVSDYTSNSTSLFTGDFTGNYASNFIGNYVADTLQSASEIIETYTLYCRVE